MNHTHAWCPMLFHGFCWVPPSKDNHRINSNLIMILNWQSSSKFINFSLFSFWTVPGGKLIRERVLQKVRVSISESWYILEAEEERVLEAKMLWLWHNEILSHERTHQQLNLYLCEMSSWKKLKTSMSQDNENWKIR